MKFLAYIVLIWVAILAIGAGFGVLGKIIWLGVLLTVIGAIWSYIKKKDAEGAGE